MSERDLIRQLADRFRRISLLLYDASVPPQRLDEEGFSYGFLAASYLACRVRSMLPNG